MLKTILPVAIVGSQGRTELIMSQNQEFPLLTSFKARSTRIQRANFPLHRHSHTNQKPSPFWPVACTAQPAPAPVAPAECRQLRRSFWQWSQSSPRWTAETWQPQQEIKFRQWYTTTHTNHTHVKVLSSSDNHFFPRKAQISLLPSWLDSYLRIRSKSLKLVIYKQQVFSHWLLSK